VAYLDNFPVDWALPVAVVTMPDEIDIANAADVRDTLLAVLNQGVSTLIVDMTGTTFCACAGASALARAHQRAGATAGQVRLVARAPIVLRLLAITGVDHLMPVFDSLSAARSAESQDSPTRTEAASTAPPPPPPRSPRPVHGA
jgi:anti-sigma B factor antagonist